MRILIDTCVLYPTVMREIVVGVAETGAFQALWSSRILEEWARAAVKLGPEGEMQARAEIALLRTRFPQAEVKVYEARVSRLWLPDENDIHVLAAAVEGSADAIMTLNSKDFPRQVLAEEGLSRIDPDTYLHGLWRANPAPLEEVARQVLHQASALSGKTWDMRALLKKARLPSLAKALA